MKIQKGKRGREFAFPLLFICMMLQETRRSMSKYLEIQTGGAM
jgi:hypothetical protein